MKKKIIPISSIFIFSIILWTSVAMSLEYITTIKVPVSLIDLPKNYTKGTITHDEIYVRIKSKGWELAKLSMGAKEEFLVSAHRRIGKHRIDLLDEMKNNDWISSSLQIVEIAPMIIEFEVDKVITKEVYIKPNLTVDFKENFGIASVLKISPQKVEISGPASVVNNIDSIYSEPVTLKDISEPVNTELEIVHISGIELSETKCNIEFDVQKIVDKSFDEIIVEIRNVPPSKEMILFPGKISVVLKGGINHLGKLPKDSVKAYIDFWSVLRNDEVGIEPIITIPNNTSLVEVKPKRLEYIIKQY
jgi:YbbR domain-containing protein